MKMRKQRLMGLALVVISGMLLALASTGTTPEEQDATAVLLTLPLGLYMIFTKTYVLYEEPEAKARGEPEPRLREAHRAAEVDPWAPIDTGVHIDPLFPWSGWGWDEWHPDTVRKELPHGKEKID